MNTAAGVIPNPLRFSAKKDTDRQRMRDLEELAEVMCAENDRLERENAELREENEVLLRRITVLDDTIGDPRVAVAMPSLSSMPSIADLEGVSRATKPTRKSGSGAFTEAVCGLLVCALLAGAATLGGLVLAGAQDTNFRWAKAAFPPAQITAGLDEARSLAVAAASLRFHPRFGAKTIAP